MIDLPAYNLNQAVDKRRGPTMTEADWLAGTDSAAMLGVVWAGASRRKGTLLNCGCLRQHWPLLDPDTHGAVEQAEGFADGVGGSPTARVLRTARFPRSSFGWHVDPKHSRHDCHAVLRNILDAMAWHSPRAVRDETRAEADRVQCEVVRCVFGNPFRPVAADGAWLTSAVVALAGGIYDERAFDRLPVLADALEQVGCDHVDVLDHCRGECVHARGCWVVDLVLGKE